MGEHDAGHQSRLIEQSGRTVSILPPLHKHTEGAASKECENVGCAGPVTLPSLSALGIAGSLASATPASPEPPASPELPASPAENGQAQRRCLWSTCTQIFVTIDELVRHLYKLHVATNRSGGR
ncbi:hypothetical protein GGI05_007778, partial [Coemansia sp. RSA 2603]